MIKTTVVDRPTKEIGFPKLMVTKEGLIVLFYMNSVGTVISDPKKSHGVGYHTEHWGMHDFIEYVGTLEITNDTY